MENQLARKKQQTEELKRKSKEALELLSGFATDLKSTSLAQDEVISEQQPSETQDTEMKETKDSQSNENTNLFIDMIDGIQ
jgi:hypothetical protein